MAKELSLAFIALFALIAQTTALSVVNNVTISSDILTTILFDEIQNNPNLSDIPVPTTRSYYDSGKCILALKYIVENIRSISVLPFFDSWGKFPSGILFFHFNDLGNFDQCVQISVKMSSTIGTVKGQYCTASIPLPISRNLQLYSRLPTDANVETNERAFSNLLRLRIGMCIPDVCDPSLVQQIIARVPSTQGALSGLQISKCTTDEKPKFEAVNIVGIVIFSIFAALMLLSTAYEVYTNYFKKPAVASLLAFSVLTNCSKLFAISLTKSPNSIDCLTGIRIFSTLWVVMYHSYITAQFMTFINRIDVLAFIKQASSFHIISSNVMVDSFLFISGLLIAWIGLRELDKSNGKLNVPLMYLHRIIRLTPAVAAVVLFELSISQYVGTGPFKHELVVNNDCKETWWSTLLYIQNYVHPGKICVGQTWYLAVDTQLYFLSPLVLIPLWKWGRKFVPVMVILSLISIGYIFSTYYSEDYHGMIPFSSQRERLTYVPTHARYSVWLIGLGFGYYMHKNKNNSFRLSKLVQLLGWLLCFGTILAIIYAPYFVINAGRQNTLTMFEAATYETMKRVGWGLALAWLVFACHFGFAGVINSFLSHPWWQPLGRLSYSIYLVHYGLAFLNIGMTQTDSYFSNYQRILFFWSLMGGSLMAAIVLTLAFEIPVIEIEKVLLGGSKSSQPRVNASQDTNIDVIQTKSVEST